jgi:hypothetical protein
MRAHDVHESLVASYLFTFRTVVVNVPSYAGGLAANVKIRLPCATTSVPRVALSGMGVFVAHVSVTVSYASFTPQPHAPQYVCLAGPGAFEGTPLLIA